MNPILSSVNRGNYKVITIFGIKIKIRQQKLVLRKIENKLARISPFGRPNFSIEYTSFLLAGMQTAEYVTKHMDKAKVFDNPLGLLSYAFSLSQKDGLNLEFGVFSGTTINHLSKEYPSLIFSGFDSFEGLPEDWRSGFEKGCFSVDKLPKVNSNVELVKGWFENTLPEFLKIHKDYCSFIHVDCDIYSSSKQVFDLCGDRIKSGTIIVFDEYFNYPAWQEHEFKAFQEFIKANNVKYEYIGYVKDFEQVAVKIL